MIESYTKVADNELRQLVGTLTKRVDDADAGHGHIVIIKYSYLQYYIKIDNIINII
jgi:hypothetical protein